MLGAVFEHQLGLRAVFADDVMITKCERPIPTCHVMVSMVLTNQRRSRYGRKTSYGTERALDLSTARSGGPWTNPRPLAKHQRVGVKNSGFHT